MVVADSDNFPLVSAHEHAVPYDPRAEAKRVRLWEAPRSAGTRQGFFEGPIAYSRLEAPKSEYSLNCRYWCRFLRLGFIGLSDVISFPLAMIVLGNVFFCSWVAPHASSPSGGLVTSISMSYVSYFRPGCQIMQAIDAWPDPTERTDLLDFAEKASRSAKDNLWYGGSYTGVGTCDSCTIIPPTAWWELGKSINMKFPETLWSGEPENVAGHIEGNGMVLTFSLSMFLLICLYALSNIFQGLLIVRMRIVITRHLHKKLFDERVLYNTVVLDKDIDNYDQRITDDLQAVCEFGFQPFVGNLILNLFNAFNGLSTAIGRLSGKDGSVVVMFWGSSLFVFFLAWLLYLVPMNAVSRLLFTSKRYEGDLRWIHSRVMANAESIAFYGGENKEEEDADAAYDRVHTNNSMLYYYQSMLYGVSIGLPNGVCNFVLFSLCYLGGFRPDEVFSFQNILRNGIQGLMAIPQAYQSLAISGGPVHRVGTFLEALHRNKTAASQSPSAVQAPRSTLGSGSEDVSVHAEEEEAQLDRISISNLCVAPPGVPRLVLFEGLSLTILPGEPLAIIGPSGCGKSSLLRIIAGLWNPLAGSVRAPTVRGRDGLFFMPQRPYVTFGTLLEQVTYPEAGSVSSEDRSAIQELLLEVGLGDVLAEWAVDASVDWRRVLTKGQLQALAFARILHHRPRFGLMDEATSALDVHREAKLMGMCALAGITAVSVCHRQSAICLHKNVLQYTGASVGARLEPRSWCMMPVPEADQVAASALWQQAIPERYPTEAVTQPAESPAAPPGTRESTGMGVAFFRRLGYLLTLSKMKEGYPLCCLIIIISITVFNSVFLCLLGAKFAGLFSKDLTTTGIIGRDRYFLIYYAFTGPIIIFNDATKAYLGQMLSLHIRRCATYTGHKNYFTRKVPYAMNCMPTSCVPGSITHWQPDQRLQQDAQMMCDYFAGSLFGGTNIARGGIVGTCGLIGSVIELIFLMGYGLTISWIMVLFSTGWVVVVCGLQYCTLPMISKGSILVQRAEGHFRNAHALVRENTESIMFHGGQAEEARRCSMILDCEVAWQRYALMLRSVPALFVGQLMNIGNMWMTNVALSFVAFYIASAPLTASSYGAASSTFGSTSVQVGWIAFAWGSLGTLAGLVHRVCHFLEASQQASTWVEQQGGAVASGNTVCAQALTVRMPLGGRSCEAREVVKDLSLEVVAGNGLAIDGNSGSGKSSLLRVFAGLWPAAAGSVTRPDLLEGSFFVPQAAYATEGTLLEQVVYSHSSGDEEHVRDCLEKVGLEHITEQWGLHQPSPWCEHLSGGELQRLALARVLYHRQRFAFMDEATSALDAASEQRCLQAARDAGITPISISMRPTAHSFHSQLLNLSGSNGDCSWEIKKLL